MSIEVVSFVLFDSEGRTDSVTQQTERRIFRVLCL